MAHDYALFELLFSTFTRVSWSIVVFTVQLVSFILHLCRVVFGYEGKSYDLKVVETGGEGTLT